MPKIPQKGAKMQTVARPGTAEQNRKYAQAAVADLIGLLQQADSDLLHGGVVLQIQSNAGKLSEHTSTYRRDRRNLTKCEALPNNRKQLNSARLQIAVETLKASMAGMVANDFTGSITIEVSFRHGTAKDPISNLRKFHRS